MRGPDGDHTAEGLTLCPVPDRWHYALSILEAAGCGLRVVSGKDLRRRWPNQQGPGTAYHCAGILWMSATSSDEDFAHEVGHAVAWALAGHPDGDNFGLDDKANNPAEAEVSACEIDAYLTTEHPEGPCLSADMVLDYHYNAGIIVNYNPDDDEEAEYALDEFEYAIELGKKSIQKLTERRNKS